MRAAVRRRAMLARSCALAARCAQRCGRRGRARRRESAGGERAAQSARACAAAPSAAPSGPPLRLTAAGGRATAPKRRARSPAGEGDPLVSNGLGSPLCSGSVAARTRRSEQAQLRNLGLRGGAAPDRRLRRRRAHRHRACTDSARAACSATVQDLLVTPVWMALVWAVHGLIVMLEWCFTIDLLDSSALAASARGCARRRRPSPSPGWRSCSRSRRCSRSTRPRPSPRRRDARLRRC